LAEGAKSRRFPVGALAKRCAVSASWSTRRNGILPLSPPCQLSQIKTAELLLRGAFVLGVQQVSISCALFDSAASGSLGSKFPPRLLPFAPTNVVLIPPVMGVSRAMTNPACLAENALPPYARAEFCACVCMPDTRFGHGQIFRLSSQSAQPLGLAYKRNLARSIVFPQFSTATTAAGAPTAVLSYH